MKNVVSLFLLSMGASGLMAQTGEFKVDVRNVGAPIRSTMYGVFFEDINFGADGGLYAEMIKNRSFEFDNPFCGWTTFGNVTVQTKSPCFDMQNEPVAGQNDLYATAAIDKTTNELIIKVANVGIQNKKVKLDLNGLSSGKHKGTVALLHASDLEAKNTLCQSNNVVPVVSEVELDAPTAEVTLCPLSFSVYRIAL